MSEFFSHRLHSTIPTCSPQPPWTLAGEPSSGEWLVTHSVVAIEKIVINPNQRDQPETNRTITVVVTFGWQTVQSAVAHTTTYRQWCASSPRRGALQRLFNYLWEQQNHCAEQRHCASVWIQKGGNFRLGQLTGRRPPELNLTPVFIRLSSPSELHVIRLPNHNKSPSGNRRWGKRRNAFSFVFLIFGSVP